MPSSESVLQQRQYLTLKEGNDILAEVTSRSAYKDLYPTSLNDIDDFMTRSPRIHYRVDYYTLEDLLNYLIYEVFPICQSKYLNHLSGVLSMMPLATKCYYSSIAVPNDPFVMKTFFGKGGCMLIQTTTKCNALLVWHNREHNILSFWGLSRHSVVRAIQRIRFTLILHMNYLTQPEDKPSKKFAHGVNYNRKQSTTSKV
jgi:hypothetical protein